MEVTVGMPTYQNSRILWLALEGLIRQECSFSWELAVMECVTDNKDLVYSYEKDLKNAGCRQVRYCHISHRLPLFIKWKHLARAAKGKVFCLQASDDYPQKDRNQKAFNAIDIGHDLFFSQYYYQYSFKHKKIIIYNHDTLYNKNRPGFNISLLSKKLASLKDSWQLRGIDNYIFNALKPKNVFYDQSSPAGGISTDGFNTLSTERGRYYTRPQAPFQGTSKTLYDIGIPAEIADRLVGLTKPAR